MAERHEKGCYPKDLLIETELEDLDKSGTTRFENLENGNFTSLYCNTPLCNKVMELPKQVKVMELAKQVKVDKEKLTGKTLKRCNKKG